MNWHQRCNLMQVMQVMLCEASISIYICGNLFNLLGLRYTIESACIIACFLRGTNYSSQKPSISFFIL